MRSGQSQLNVSTPDAIQREGKEPLGPLSIGLAVLTVMLWGGTAVANSIAMDIYPPLFVGGVRFGLAAIFMVAWCWIEKTPLWLRGVQWWFALIVGFLMFLQIATFSYGTAISNSSHAIVLVNSYVFWVAFYEGIIRRSIHFQWWQVLGLFLAGGGIIVLVANAEAEAVSKMDQPTLVGDLILALSGFSLAVKALVVKEAVRRVPSSSLILWHDVFGTGMLLAFSFSVEQHSNQMPTVQVVGALLFGGIAISGVCFVVNAMLLKKHCASQIAVFSFLSPLFGIVLAFVLRGDHLSRWLLLAGILVAAGIYLVNVASADDR